ncbi:MAG TPA: hypothetical protein DG942_08350 [Ruminococcaceae bacterium]|nr:hypothetical protein [Oscillospiraceae bacterium]
MNDSNQEPWNSSQGSDGGDNSRPENSGNSPSEEPAAADEKQEKQPENGQEAGSSTEEGKSPTSSGEPDAGQKQQGGLPPYGQAHGGQGWNQPSYGGYYPYSKYGYYQDRYDNPYSPQQNQQPPWGPNGPMPPKQHHKMGSGLKTFFWVIGIVAAGLVVAFAVFAARPGLMQQGADSQSGQASSSQSSSSGINGTMPKNKSGSSGSGSVISGISGNGIDPNAKGITIQSKPTGSAMSAKDVYKKVIQSVVGVETTVSSASSAGGGATGEGTGIVASSDGYILTNAHVVGYSRNNTEKVILHSNKAYQAKVVGYDKTSDLAVLKINANNLSPATFGSIDSMEIGDEVLAIGNPGGLSFAGSLTGGMISALNRTIENYSANGMTYIQTDAAINPGNSGGPLVNMYAQVIGINSNKIAATGYEGMGFAIPVSRAAGIINQLVRNSYVSGRCRLGITGQNVGSAQAGLFGSTEGIMIRSIESDSYVGRAGAKVGDIITAADGKKVTSLDDLNAILSSRKPGDTITMTVYADAASGNGHYKTINVKLLEDKGETQR